MTVPDRPRTTTRHPAALARALDAWLATRLPGARALDPVVPESNGMSSETVLFGLDHPDAPATGCALRLAADPAAYTVFPRYDMARQYRTQRLVAAHSDVPVPRVLWLEEDEGPLGAPFFVMERVEGRVPPDVMPYTYEGNWLHSATDAERAALQEATLSVLARLHGQVPAELAGFLAEPGPGTPLRRHVAAQRRYYEWVVADQPRSPVIERGFAWLTSNWPDEEGDTVVCWGDARIGNIVYDGFEPVAVLDWEMAALGPRELDLGWTVYLHRFFQDLTESMGQEGLPGFFDRRAVEARYAELTGHTPRAMDFHTFYAALRHAIVMLRIAYRRIHFGEAVPPPDPDDLIMHRASLERMLEGSYWGEVRT
ncbi:phosphotransferase family protein [Streptomyces sp. NPDC048172]|uniref:phosphotransferase family protein n=1 Tax=Streptomyces sp. NPDC048172 TaxID=3365505 RepID=UPI00372464CC